MISFLNASLLLKADSLLINDPVLKRQLKKQSTLFLFMWSRQTSKGSFIGPFICHPATMYQNMLHIICKRLLLTKLNRHFVWLFTCCTELVENWILLWFCRLTLRSSAWKEGVGEPVRAEMAIIFKQGRFCFFKKCSAQNKDCDKINMWFYEKICT